MNFEEKLLEYTVYANGDLSKKCDIHYEDEKIMEFDFSRYDLNNTYFGGVYFNKCKFNNVYFSGSNFGGSVLENCLFENNVNIKSSWDDIVIQNSNVIAMDAFKSSFMFSKFHNVIFSQCNFKNSNFSDSEFVDVQFVDCEVNDAVFSRCKFVNTILNGRSIDNKL